MTIAQKVRPPAPPHATHEGDYYGWLVEQAALLETGQAARADFANIAEALQDLGNEQVHRLESSLRVLLIHLLKWDHQPAKRTRSWVLSIKVRRLEVEDALAVSPSLRSKLSIAIERASRKARLKAAGQTGLPEKVFPLACPYSFDDMMTREIAWPPRA